MKPLDIFEKFLSIPRESGNEAEISNYIVEFAKERNLEYYQDDYGNVIIKKKGTKSGAPIILQGHIDMVCTSNNNFDFKNNGIKTFVKDNIMYTEGTTMGADNGLGCSIILAILDNNVESPDIEALFTVSEETTMLGARMLDYSKLEGKRLISIDGTEEGVIEVSSAGMASISLTKKLIPVENNNKSYKIEIDGLPGGHSGVDIDKKIKNSIKVLNEILESYQHICINYIDGGVRDNVIPSTSMCIISTDNEINVDNLPYKDIKDLKITISEVDECVKVYNYEDSKRIIELIHTIPHGVLSRINGFPQTSVNLAKISTNNDLIKIDISIRSSSKEEETKYINYIKDLARDYSFTLNSTLPFFTFNEKSMLRDILVDKYEELYNKKVKIEHVHAGLEGGVFEENISDIDICVIAPNLYDIHTVNERFEIDSVDRVYTWVVETLKNI